MVFVKFSKYKIKYLLTKSSNISVFLSPITLDISKIYLMLYFSKSM